MNIPKIMVHIWIGPKDPPLHWMNTWKEKHPDWDYRIFDNKELEQRKGDFYCEHVLDTYLKRGKYNGAADIIRYEMLYRYGGFFPPADAICHHNTDELWDQPEDFCYGVLEGSPNPMFAGNISPIYACSPGNTFVKTILDRVEKLAPYQVAGPAATSGNHFLRLLLQEVRPVNIKIFPSHYFIPVHFESPDKRYDGPDKVYADQMWGSTTKAY
jgi:hypothetical protein